MKLFQGDSKVTAVIVFLCSVLLPAKVQAHLVTTGMGPIYDGTGHLLLTPEDLIPVLAIAAYAGLQGREYGRNVLFLLPLSWFLAGVFGLGVEQLPTLPYGSFSFLFFGLLIATDTRIPLLVLLPVTVVAGILHGVFNGFAMKAGTGVLGLVGIMITVFAAVALVSSLAVVCNHSLGKIIMRVMGSWIAASGLLMVGWFFRIQS